MRWRPLALKVLANAAWLFFAALMAPGFIQLEAAHILTVRYWADDFDWGTLRYLPPDQILTGAPHLGLSTLGFLPTLLLSFVTSGLLRWCLWLGACLAYLIEVLDAFSW